MKPLSHKIYYSFFILFCIGVAFGAFLFGGNGDKESDSSLHPAHIESEPQTWTCSMHPQVILPKAGQCPICFMDLIPLTVSGSKNDDIRQISISERAAKLAEIQTIPVERKFVSSDIRMVGKIDTDETRMKYITAWFPGRLERLYVDYTGIPVKKGDHLIEIYSPELLTAQNELLGAIRSADRLKTSPSAPIRRTAKTNIDAAREKLKLWGLSQSQIDQIITEGKTSNRTTIYAPSTGIVIHKNATEGMYVQTGTRIYTIADLEHLWVRIEAYESDLQWLRYGQNIEFTVEAYPGEVFHGKVSFIDPILNERTRTVKVRLNIENPDGRLKPGMFVRAIVKSKLSADGRVVADYLEGKWISPMHPEIIKDGPGNCDVCGMPLVRAESLGFAGSEKNARPPLVIPASAPLITGKKAIVYIKLPEKEKPTFIGREVVLGSRAGDYYIVKTGVNEGDEIVIRGNFKIDSALQIEAKPSMMSSEGNSMSGKHLHGPLNKPAHEIKSTSFVDSPESFKNKLTEVFNRYLALQKSLAEDDFSTAVTSLDTLKSSVEAIPENAIKPPHDTHWKKEHGNMVKSLMIMAKATKIEELREGFSLFSETLSESMKVFRVSSGTSVYQLHCPMAFNNRGANWLQSNKETLNPYFGSTMLRCGSVVSTISGSESEKE